MPREGLNSISLAGEQMRGSSPFYERGISPEQRFWKRVKKTDSGCWIWMGHIHKDGHPEFRVASHGICRMAYVYSWIIHFGDIPNGLHVRHVCDNRLCVNPGHLYLGKKPVKKKPDEERFWSKVRKAEAGCWNWTKGSGSSGYANLKLSNGKSMSVHRYSWELHNGPIPDNLWVLHKCDNRVCVRPDHLFLGTPQDNALDMVAKGRNLPAVLASRQRPGVLNAKAKLDDDKVREIRDLRSSGMVYREIASRFGVSLETCMAVVKGKTWKHVKAYESDPESLFAEGTQ